MKMFVKIVDLKKNRRPISKFSNYGSNKPFRSKFCAKLCRIQWRRRLNQKQGEWRAWEASAKKNYEPAKKNDMAVLAFFQIYLLASQLPEPAQI